jgi:hypothetical protein
MQSRLKEAGWPARTRSLGTDTRQCSEIQLARKVGGTSAAIPSVGALEGAGCEGPQDQGAGNNGAKLSQLFERQSTLNTVKVHIRTRWSKSPLVAFRNNPELAKASTNLHLLYGQAISLAIIGAKEEDAIAEFNAAWEGEHTEWRYHLEFAPTSW